MLLKEIVKQPGKYFEKFGFSESEEETTDSIRWVWFRKLLFTIDDLNIIFELTFSLSIFDNPFVKSDENFQFSFEFCKIISTKSDIDFKRPLSDRNSVNTTEATLNILTINELRSFLLSVETINNFI